MDKNINLDPIILDTGIILYKNIFKNTKNILKEIENILNNSKIYKWNNAKVGYNETILDYRKCLDFKFDKSKISGEDSDSNKIKEIWQYLHDTMNIATEEYKKIYPMENLNFWESINLIKYVPGDHFDTHADDGASYKSVLSLVGYLNEDYEGGELYFPIQNLIIKPNIGDLVIFPSNFIYPHKALPVINGTKYSIVTMLDYHKKFHNLKVYNEK